mmetsp:Transcript_61541/g.144769  ORF Transcript_61541/g.144769 Transcript_61541/m.144769 type:complete len:118 (-) Transcript_61541:120-473(-)
MATTNLMSDEVAAAPSEHPAQASSWTFSSLLGLDDCCAVASFSGLDQAQTAMADGVRTTSPGTEETKHQSKATALGKGGLDQNGSWEDDERQQEEEASALYNLSVLQGTNFSLMGHT